MNTQKTLINFQERKLLIELKAQMLCQGVNVDSGAEKLFRQQNPSNVKRGGLSSGGKMQLAKKMFVNAPFYKKRKTGLKIIKDPKSEQGVFVRRDNKLLCPAEALIAPKWYQNKIGKFDITQIFTAHNKQLVGAVYEDCALFSLGAQCKFCVINNSLTNKDPRLVKKTGKLLLAALGKIPVNEYTGLSLNGGMTFNSGRGVELIEPVVRLIKQKYPKLPIAIEITPPKDLDWITRLADAGVDSLMMNLECWDPNIRAQLIPGKNNYCPRELYLKAFEWALKYLGPGKVSSCFVVGSEPVDSLKEGIKEIISLGVVPSPLAGRYFEDVRDYPFTPNVDYREFLDILYFTGGEMVKQRLISTDKAGCVACGMCDLVSDVWD